MRSSPCTHFSSVERGERIARPLAEPGRIRRETLTVEYRPDHRSSPEGTHRITPGTAFRRETPDDARYYLYLGVSAADSECLYFYELGPEKYGASAATGLPQLINRTAWVEDYTGGFSRYERVPLADAIEAAYADADSS